MPRPPVGDEVLDAVGEVVLAGVVVFGAGVGVTVGVVFSAPSRTTETFTIGVALM